MAGVGSNIFARGWRNIREAGAKRLAVTALLLVAALLLARFSWFLPVTDEAETLSQAPASSVIGEVVELNVAGAALVDFS